RVADGGAKLLLTSPELWARVKEIRSALPELRHVVILDRHGGAAPAGTVAWGELFDGQPDAFEIERTDPEDFAVMHYNSGTTGQPKGAAHAHTAAMGPYATASDVL